MTSTHQIRARFQDGEERMFESRPGQSLLEAALSQNVNLIHQCRAGSCSSCICQKIDGDLAMATSTSIALLPREIAEGKVLSCLSFATSDCTVEFPYESSLLDREGPHRHLAEVTSCTRMSETALELNLSVERGGEAGEPDFEPGAYYLIGVPGTEQTRAYSVASIPSELPDIKFLIRHLPGGAMSTYLASLCQAGDFLEIEGPFGEFKFRETRGPLIMVAGGTGLAPILSMLDALREARRHRAAITLIFGVRTYDDLFYLDELELRREMIPHFNYRAIVEEADLRWPGPVGRVTDLLGEVEIVDGMDAYLCGPPGMIAAVSDRLTGAGIPAERIYYERFTPAEPALA